MLLCGAMVAAPLLAAAGHPAALGIYAGFSLVCHQQAGRSWELAGFPLAVCVRCLGVYAGALAGIVFGAGFSGVGLAVSAAVLGIEWGGEKLGWIEPVAPVAMARFLTGLGAGFFALGGLLTEPRSWVSRITGRG